MNPKTKCVALYYNLHKFDWLIQPMIHMKPKACTHNIFLKIISIQSLANIYFDYIWLFTIIMCVRLQNTLFHYCNLVCVYLAYLKKECGIILYQEWNAVIEVWSFWSATLERISYEYDNCCLHFYNVIWSWFLVVKWYEMYKKEDKIWFGLQGVTLDGSIWTFWI